MRIHYRLLLFMSVVVFTLASCQKEVSDDSALTPGGPPTPGDTIPNNTNTEIGTWKFISMQGNVNQTAEFSQSGFPVKAVSTSNFTSENNGGTVTFNSSTMTANGITLSVNTVAKTYVYMGGLLIDSLDSPLTQTITPQTISSDYKKPGADSLYFQDGAFLDVLTGGLLPAAPTGCRLLFESNNIMKLRIVYNTVLSQDYQGIPAKITLHAELVATLQKN